MSLSRLSQIKGKMQKRRAFENNVYNVYTATVLSYLIAVTSELEFLGYYRNHDFVLRPTSISMWDIADVKHDICSVTLV